MRRLRSAFSWQGAVPFSFGLFDEVEESCGKAARGVLGLSHFTRDFVGGAKSDSRNLPREPVRVRSKNGNDFLAVGLVKSQGPGRGNPVPVEKNHEIPDGPLLFPRFFYPDSPGSSDSGDLLEALGFLLDDAKSVLSEKFHNSFGVGRSDPINESAREETSDSVGRFGRKGVDVIGLELVSETAILFPSTLRPDPLAFDHGGEPSPHRDSLTAGPFHLHDGVAVFLIVENNGMDRSLDLGGGILVRTHGKRAFEGRIVVFWPFTSLLLCRIFAPPWQFYPFC